MYEKEREEREQREDREERGGRGRESERERLVHLDLSVVGDMN